MAYKHTVYIPQHDNDHSESSYVRAPTIKSTLVEAFVVNFGGATVTEGYGYYKMSDGFTVEDKVWIVQTIADVPSIDGILAFHITNIKNVLKQESVLYTVESFNNVTFVS
jgi:hypothetical protein